MHKAARFILAVFGFVLAGATVAQSPDALTTSTPVEPDEAVLEHPPPSTSPDPLGAAPSADLVRLGAFVDGVVSQAMRRDKIAGLALAIVRDGRVVLLRGYGTAGGDPERAVDPELTGFRIGSISKTFTYVAAMQLIEQGGLHLDDPINEHLPESLRIPADGFDQPIRIRHLFTHSAGFEDLAVGHLFERDPTAVPTRERYLQQHRPKRVRPPGQRVVYSNYGVALLAAVVAQVSGEDFIAYVERQLFAPLAMGRTTLREPLPEAHPDAIDVARTQNWSRGFRRIDGGYRTQSMEHIAQVAGSGGVTSTAADMARWMALLLGEGEWAGVRLLAPESLRQMREVQVRNAPEVNGIGLGFITDRIGPYATFGHGGATLYFHSNMVVVPELGLGIFITTNTDTGRRFAAEFPIDVVEYLDPAARPAHPAGFPITQAQLERFVGLYLNERRPHRRADTVLLSIGAQSRVAVADGALVLHQLGEATRWWPIGPLRFREAEGHRVLAFEVDAHDRVIGYALPNGISYATRVGLWRGNIGMLVLALVSAAVASLGVLLAALLTRRGAAPSRPRRPLVTAVMLLTALLWLAAVTLLGIAVLDYSARQAEVVFIYPTPIWRDALWATTSAVLASMVSALAVVVLWRRDGLRATQLAQSLVVMLWLGAAAAVWTWNLLIWRV